MKIGEQIRRQPAEQGSRFCEPGRRKNLVVSFFCRLEINLISPSLDVFESMTISLQRLIVHLLDNYSAGPWVQMMRKATQPKLANQA